MNARLGSSNFWAITGRQLRRPRGWFGWILGHVMSVMNWHPYLLTINRLDLRADDAVLELGFGSGRSLQHLLKRVPIGSVAAIDHSEVMVDMARRRTGGAMQSCRLQIYQGAFSSLPFMDCTFDRILLVNVVYFFDRAGNDMGECFRVLKPGGRAVVYVTERSTMGKWRFCEEKTHRTFDREDAAKLMTDAGFELCHIKVENVDLPFGIKGLVLTVTK
jgi:SAM-dependent methyltransferase